MRRREFVILFGSTAVGWPLAASAQPSTAPLIGTLFNTSRNTLTEPFTAFRRGLAEAGYVEGQNVAIEYRFADGQSDRLPALAADLVNRKVAVLVGMDNAAALAAKAATKTIPVIFVMGVDPVKRGMVARLNRPDGNVTGVTWFTNQLESKRLGLLHELVPHAAKIAVLINPGQPAAADQEEEVTAAGHVLSLQVHVVHASSESDFETAFATCQQLGTGGLLVAGDVFFWSRREQIIALAARRAMPAVYQMRDFVVLGGLASYGTSLTDVYRQAGVYTGKVVGGAKTIDLPVVQTTKFELVINLKTANALGIDVPPMLSARADEVIE
jgi:putative tryptophan/tyrosine transport system substrate-binding protein